MKMLRVSLFGSLIVGLILVGPGRGTTASPRAACEVLSLAEVRSLVGAQVTVFPAGSSPATTRGDSTVSTCTYVTTDANGHQVNGLGAKFTLMWGPKATLGQSNDYYIKRHIEASGLKGDVLAVAWIGDASKGKTGDWSASQKLLAAVLQKL